MENSSVMQQFEATLRCIEDDILAEQLNTNLISKWCKPLNCVSIYNYPKSSYLKYHISPFLAYPKLAIQIRIAVENKFRYGLTDPEKFVDMVVEGADYYYQVRRGPYVTIVNEKEDILREFGYKWCEE